MWNSHCDIQNPVRAGRRTGEGATHIKAGQHRYWGPAVDENHHSHSHAIDLGLHGMGDEVRELKPRGGHHRL